MEQGTGIEPVHKTVKPLIMLHFFGLRLHYDGKMVRFPPDIRGK